MFLILTCSFLLNLPTKPYEIRTNQIPVVSEHWDEALCLPKPGMLRIHWWSQD